jgi:hypothetical protein
MLGGQHSKLPREFPDWLTPRGRLLIHTLASLTDRRNVTKHPIQDRTLERYCGWAAGGHTLRKARKDCQPILAWSSVIIDEQGNHIELPTGQRVYELADFWSAKSALARRTKRGDPARFARFDPIYISTVSICTENQKPEPERLLSLAQYRREQGHQSIRAAIEAQTGAKHA